MTPTYAAAISTWTYPAPRDRYDMTASTTADLLDPAAGFHAVLASGELVGFRSFGADGQVPGWTYPDDPPGTLDTGGGLRPELVGLRRGLGRAVITAGLAFGQARFAPAAFRVSVTADNGRALRVVTTLGFEETARFTGSRDARAYVVLVRPAREEGWTVGRTAARRPPGSR